MTLSLTQWLLLIILGGIAGTLGQAIRTIVGIKKLDDQAAVTEGKTREDLLSASRIIISMFIGFTGGALAALSTVEESTIAISISKEQLLAFMAAGYAGADFIEGVMSRFVPSDSQKVNSSLPENSVTLSGKTISQPSPSTSGEGAKG